MIKDGYIACSAECLVTAFSLNEDEMRAGAERKTPRCCTASLVEAGTMCTSCSSCLMVRRCEKEQFKKNDNMINGRKRKVYTNGTPAWKCQAKMID